MSIQPLDDRFIVGQADYTFECQPENILTLPGEIPTHAVRFYTRARLPEYINDPRNTGISYSLIHFDASKHSASAAFRGICGTLRRTPDNPLRFEGPAAGASVGSMSPAAALSIQLGITGLHFDFIKFDGHELSPFFNVRYKVRRFDPPFNRTIENAADKAWSDWIKLRNG